MYRFVVTSSVAGAPEKLDISQMSFASAKRNWRLLTDALLIEERFDSLVMNFLKFEEILVARLLQFERVGFIDSNHQMLVRRDLNRVLNNVLSTARGYIDQLPQVANEVFGTNDPRTSQCTEILREQYDSLPGYRIFEAIRNHSQHSGYPIHSVAYATRMIGKFPKLIVTKCLKPLTQPALLAENRRFKKPILRELTSMGQQVDLQPLLRQYIAGISRAHYFIRSEAKEAAIKGGAALDVLANSYLAKAVKSESRLGVYAVKLENDIWVEKIPLLTGTAEYLSYLCSLNVHLNFADKEFLIGSPEENA